MSSLLGCTDGPAKSAALLAGDRVAYALRSAFLIGIEVVDTIVGPCV